MIGLTWFMLFNATFNNISIISWRSVVFVEETGVTREKMIGCITNENTLNTISNIGKIKTLWTITFYIGYTINVDKKELYWLCTYGNWIYIDMVHLS